MVLSIQHRAPYSALFGDDELADIFLEERDIARMISFERALARVQGNLGVIPAAAAAGIDAGLRDAEVSPRELVSGTAAAGVPVPALIAALRNHIPDEHARWLHWGATSQDVVDTATMMALNAALGVIGHRLTSLVDVLRHHASAQKSTVMAARTRGQIATPITFGLRIAQWAQPLIEAEATRSAIFAQNLRVQFGGASGSNAAVAPHGRDISRALAHELDLTYTPPWHTNRAPILALMEWTCVVTRALGKMGEDLVLMMRRETAEISTGAGGGSSTMPQKSNPVGPEAMLTLARLAETAKAGLGYPHREERDGAAWAVEWALVPQIVMAAGAALRHARQLADTLSPDVSRMHENLTANPGVMAEAASFALARHIPRSEAQELVKAALSDDLPFADALAARAPVTLNWAQVLDPAQVAAPSAEMIDDIFSGRP